MAEGLVTRRELAERRGVHMMTVTKWELEGMPVAEHNGPGRPSRYDPKAVDAWLDERKQNAEANRESNTTGQQSFLKERAFKERWQGLLAEQQFKLREKELLPRGDVERAWAAEVAAVRSQLLALPTTMADRIHRAAVIDGVEGVERALDEAVRNILRELSDPKREPADNEPASTPARRSRKARKPKRQPPKKKRTHEARA